MRGAFKAAVSAIVIGASGWVLAESAFSIGVISGAFRPNREGTYYGGPLRTYDATRGYRWTGDGRRVARVYKGALAFDRPIRVNNEGFVSQRDYHRSRPPGVFRVAVFGDSFTDASYLPHTWVDTANALGASAGGAEATGGGERIEFYSFAMDGAGLANWEHSLREYVLPRYEIDAVVVASFHNDLVRGFTVIDDDANMSYLRQFPAATSMGEADVRRLVRECPLAPVFDEGDIDFMLGLGERRILLIPPAALYAGLRLRTRRAESKDLERCYYFLSATERDVILDRFLDTLSAAGKPVVWATGPGREELKQYLAHGTRAPGQDDDAALAARRQLIHYDGYAAFRDRQDARPSAFVDERWLRADPHWNEKGGDLFAAGLVSRLRESLLPRRRLAETAGNK